MNACSIFESSGLNPFLLMKMMSIVILWLAAEPAEPLSSSQINSGRRAALLLGHARTCPHTRLCALWQSTSIYAIAGHGRTDRLGCRPWGSTSRPWQVWNVAFAKFCELNGPHFDFQGCEFPPNAEKDLMGSTRHDVAKG